MIKVTNITWDTYNEDTGKEEKVNLPSEVSIEEGRFDDVELEEIKDGDVNGLIPDFLSDHFGFCVKDCRYEVA